MIFNVPSSTRISFFMASWLESSVGWSTALVSQVHGVVSLQAWILEASLSRMLYLSIQMWWLSNYKVCSSHNYMIFVHSLSYIHLSRVHYELTQWPVPCSWLNILVGKSAAPASQGHGFETRSSVIFFQAFCLQLFSLHIQLQWSSMY